MVRYRLFFSASLAAIFVAAAASAQEPSGEEGAGSAQTADETSAELNPDESASYLNSQQQIEQTFTFTRTINGEVVETEQRTLTYSPSDPTRPTEAGLSALEKLREAFDREVLTRTEAFDEARLDFVLADKDRDNMMSTEEFVGLAEYWRTNYGAQPLEADGDPEAARQRRYREFLAELDPAAARQEADEKARRRFGYMAGVSGKISMEDYLQEYLLDFDSMDADGDGILRGEELTMFRAINRGEDTPPTP